PLWERLQPRTLALGHVNRKLAAEAAPGGDAEESGIRELVLLRRRIQLPALLAGAVVARGVEALEHRRKVLLDVVEEEVLLVQLVVAPLAEPQQAVVLVRQAFALDDQADRTGHALRR